MSNIVGRSAFRATRALRESGVNSGARNNVAQKEKSSLGQGAKKDPELFILLAIMTGAFTMVCALRDPDRLSE